MFYLAIKIAYSPLSYLLRVSKSSFKATKRGNMIEQSEGDNV